jgi:hypothetical protein
MNKRLEWTNIGSKNVLVIDQTGLSVTEGIALLQYTGNVITNSGKGNIVAILNMQGSKLSSNLLRAAQSTMYQTLGLIQEVVIVGDSRTQALTKEAFARQLFFKLKTADSVDEAKQKVAGSTSFSSFFNFSNLLGRQTQ